MEQRLHQYIARLRLQKLEKLVRKYPWWTEYLLVGAFYGLLAALFMGPILFHFNSAIHGFWGDGTGGLVWVNSLDLPPFGGATDMTNFPATENLFRAEYITSALYAIPVWALSNIFGAVAAWNIVVLLSFWICGISMYALAKRVSGSRLAALWAGVAFAYLPLHQYKAFGHLAYVLTFIFVFVFWWVLNFLRQPSRRNAVILALLFVMQFYVDAYYVLFGLILVGVPLTYELVRRYLLLDKKNLADFKEFLVSCAVFVGTSIVALLPIIYMKIVYGAQIASNLSLARGDFLGNVKVYTARLYDYVIPIETHPVFGGVAQEIRKTYNHGSNPSEYSLYLGIVLFALVGYTLYLVYRKKPAITGVASRRVIMVALVTASVALVLSLQPVIHVLGYRIPTPSGVLSVLVQFWRVLARLVIIIDLLLVLVASIGLGVLLARQKNMLRKVGLVSLLIVITFFEYLSFNPFHRTDIWYYDSLSSANRWLADQKDITAIAEYPLVDQPFGAASLYTTEQQVHGKKMLNAGSVTNEGRRLRASISGLRDPQTVRALKGLGVQALVTHETAGEQAVSGLRRVYSANEAPAGYAADVEVFRIADDVVAARNVLVADAGFVDVTSGDLTTQHFFDAGETTLTLAPVGAAGDQPVRVAFDITTTGSTMGDMVIIDGLKVIKTVELSLADRQTISLDLQPGRTVRVIMPAAGISPRTVYISNLRS